jgi:hypothetical protein
MPDGYGIAFSDVAAVKVVRMTAILLRTDLP